MKISAYNFFALVVICIIISGCAMTSSSNKWRLQLSGGAHSDGEIVVAIKPVGGEEFTVMIPVKGGTSENNVAKIVTKTLQEQLSEETFHVEKDDGEDVLIKKRHGAADFDVRIVSNTVQHVRINPDKE